MSRRLTALTTVAALTALTACTSGPAGPPAPPGQAAEVRNAGAVMEDTAAPRIAQMLGHRGRT